MTNALNSAKNQFCKPFLLFSIFNGIYGIIFADKKSTIVVLCDSNHIELFAFHNKIKMKMFTFASKLN